MHLKLFVNLQIPLIKEAMKMSVKEIRLEAASWSPPTWMKSADSFNGLAFLKNEYHDAYTNYLLRLVDNVVKVNKVVYTSLTMKGL